MLLHVFSSGTYDGSTLFVFGTKEEAEAEKRNVVRKEQKTGDDVEGSQRKKAKGNSKAEGDLAVGLGVPEESQVPIQGSSPTAEEVKPAEPSEPVPQPSVRSNAVIEEVQPGDPTQVGPEDLSRPAQDAAAQPDSALLANMDNGSSSPSKEAPPRRKKAATLKAEPIDSMSRGVSCDQTTVKPFASRGEMSILKAMKWENYGGKNAAAGRSRGNCRQKIKGVDSGERWSRRKEANACRRVERKVGGLKHNLHEYCQQESEENTTGCCFKLLELP